MRALHNLCKANVLAMHAILDVNPKAMFIQSEASEFHHPLNPSSAATTHIYNQKRFLSLDLSYGNPVTFEMYEYLMDNAMTRDEYHWFCHNHRKEHGVMGTDYYETNEHLVASDGSVTPSGEDLWLSIFQPLSPARHPHRDQSFRRRGRAAWIRKEWANVHRLREDGVP